MHSTRCSSCQAIDSIKSDKNNSGNSEVAWQDPSSLAGRAMCCHPHREQGQQLHAEWSPPAPTPAPQHSRASPDPTLCFSSILGWFLASNMAGGGAGAAGKAASRGCRGEHAGTPLRPARTAQTPAWLRAHVAQAGWAFLPTSLSPAWVGWAVGRQSCLLLRTTSPGPAGAGASLPAAAAHAGRASLGHAELPASAGPSQPCKQQRC